MTKLPVALRDFANAPKNLLSFVPPYLPGRPYLSTTRAFQCSVPHFFMFCQLNVSICVRWRGEREAKTGEGGSPFSSLICFLSTSTRHKV